MSFIENRDPKRSAVFENKEMTPELERAIAIASQVRADIEELIDGVFKSRSYETAAELFRGMCAIASERLFTKLVAAGIDSANIVLGHYIHDVEGYDNGSPGAEWGSFNHHAWVTVGDQIIDVTATQFHIDDPVYFPRTSEQISLYAPKEIGESAIQEIAKWQKDQNFYTFRNWWND